MNYSARTDVRLGLLTGSTKTKRKQEILDELANGELDVIIGTHALIQENVLFQRLGLGIIDEQSIVLGLINVKRY